MICVKVILQILLICCISRCSAKILQGVFNTPKTPTVYSDSNVTEIYDLSHGRCIPPRIKNGGFSVRGQFYIYQTAIPNFATVYLECNEGYSLYPRVEINVCMNGSWYRELPQCLRKCPILESKTVDFSCEINGVLQESCFPAVEGTILLMSCKEHYTQLINSPYSTTVCKNGEWDNPLITCTPACGDIIPKGHPYVVNGKSVEVGDFPWHVGIYEMSKNNSTYLYTCGGSIISTRIVVTAAHCVTDDSNGNLYEAWKYTIVAGKYFSSYDASNDKFAQQRDIAQILIPTGYKGSLSNYARDLALIVVNQTFSFNNVIKPVCIDWDLQYEEEQLVPGNHGDVVGWGYTEDKTRKESHQLKRLSPPYVEEGECIEKVPPEFIKFVTTDKICAGFTNGSSVCIGDSGGGLVFGRKEHKVTKYYLRGIVSAGPLKEGSCDSNQYSVYTRVSDYLSFIRRIEALNRVKEN